VRHTSTDESQVKEVFINEGRGNSPSHLKFFLLVFSKLKEDIKREAQAQSPSPSPSPSYEGQGQVLNNKEFCLKVLRGKH